MDSLRFQNLVGASRGRGDGGRRVGGGGGGGAGSKRCV